MTFREQVAWCARWGLAAIILAVVVFQLAQAAGPSQGSNVGRIVEGVTSAIGAFGLVALLFGVVVRAAQRWIWLKVYRQPQATRLDPRLERVYVEGWQSSFWRAWLWLDEAGNDRDARP